MSMKYFPPTGAVFCYFPIVNGLKRVIIYHKYTNSCCNVSQQKSGACVTCRKISLVFIFCLDKKIFAYGQKNHL